MRGRGFPLVLRAKFLGVLRDRSPSRASLASKVRARSFPAALFLSSLSLFCSRVALSSRSYSFSLSFQNAFVCARASVCLERPDLRLMKVFFYAY